MPSAVDAESWESVSQIDLGVTTVAFNGEGGAIQMSPDRTSAEVLSDRSLVVEFFEAADLAKYANRLQEAAGAETLDDLRLLKGPMIEELIEAVGLKMVPAQKLRLAISTLNASPSSNSPGPSIATGDVAKADSAVLAKHLEECIAVCIDRSGSMGTPFHEVTLNVVKGEERDSIAQRTRMEAVKAMFYAFRDRLASISRNGSHQLSLFQYDSEVEQLLGLTDDLAQFEAVIDDMQKRGATAIYTSIIDAVRTLEPVFKVSPSTDLRVLVLTDGQNNSGARPELALAAASQIGAVVDAIIVGDRPDGDLRKIVSGTGGQCYQIHDLGAGFELLEAEAVVSLRARRGGADKPPFAPLPVDFNKLKESTMSQSGTKIIANQTVSLPRVSVLSTAIRTPSQITPKQGTPHTPAVKRALTELGKVASGASEVWMHTGEGVHIFPSEEDLTFWRALIEGPVGTPFEKGVFALTVRLPNDYPFRPPTIRFETPVYHANVSDAGGICLDILDQSWSPSLSVPKALEAIRILLGKPDLDNALRQWIAELTRANLQFGDSDKRYVENVILETQKHASRTVAEWKAIWGCA